MDRNRERLLDLFEMEDKHHKMLLEYRDARKIYLLKRREGVAIFIISLLTYFVAGWTANLYTLACAVMMTILGWVHVILSEEFTTKHGKIARSVLSLRKDIDLQRMIVEKDEVHDFLPHGLVHLRKKIEGVKKEIEKIG